MSAEPPWVPGKSRGWEMAEEGDLWLMARLTGNRELRDWRV